MNPILHILNGDSTAHSFKETGLEGDMLVWREILSQGPLMEDISSGAFWKMRERWICKTFNDQPEHYQEYVVGPLEKLNEPYDEINLWFEFDLHCQANMLGVLALLQKKTDLSPPPIYLICPADFPGKSDFRGMGELNSMELEYLFDNIRVQLGEIDFIIAEETWKEFITCNPKVLWESLQLTTFWGNLHSLKPALEAHLKRLEINNNGLNYIEQKLLDIYNSGIKNKQAIYEVFWQTEKIYGMGDREIDIYLEMLADKKLTDLRP
jgi:hypothetical protein